MKALQKTKPAGGLELRDVQTPQAPEGQDVLLRVSAAGICGSDLHIDNWSAGYNFMKPHLPLTLGHEFSGVVEQIGPAVTSLSIGDRVVVAPGLNCGKCAACRAMDLDNCADMAIPGLTSDGGFGTFAVAPETSVFPLPDAMDLEVAALTEPMCVAYRAVAESGLIAGERVVVLGPGTIGQSIAVLARAAGAVSVVVGYNDAHRLATLGKLGFETVFDLAEPGQAENLANSCGNSDVIFEATGNSASIGQAMDLLRIEGRLVVTGIHSDTAELDLLSLVRRRIRMIGSHKFKREDWPRVIDFLHRNQDMLRPMITHRFPLAQGLEAFHAAHAKQASKVILRPGEVECEGNASSERR